MSIFLYLGIINFEKFRAIIKKETSIDERMLREAFESLYPKEKKSTGHMVDYDRFRHDMLDVKFLKKKILNYFYFQLICFSCQKGDCFTEQEFEAIRTLLFTKEGKIDLQKVRLSLERI